MVFAKTNPDDIAQVRKWTLAGVKRAEQAKRLGVSERTISRYRLLAGVASPTPTRGASDENRRNAIMAAAKDGWPMAEITRTFHVKRETVYALTGYRGWTQAQNGRMVMCKHKAVAKAEKNGIDLREVVWEK